MILKLFRLIEILFVVTLLMSWSAACSTDTPVDGAENLIPTEQAPPLQSGQIRQWASEAEASSEFSDPEWAASQAVGAPDTRRCGDYQTAWATASSDTESAWLEVTYPTAVYVTAINIVQSFNPNQIVKVELVGAFDRSVTIYEGTPTQIDQPCPYTLSVAIEKTTGRYSKVRVWVDQSVLGLGWNQIDAVELVGDTN